MKIRNFESRDWRKVIELWNNTLWADKIYEELFIERFLLEPNFDQEGFWVADDGGELKAAAIGFCRTCDQPWGFDGMVETDKDKGFLVPLMMEDNSAGEKIGRQLLERVEEYFQEREKKVVSVCEYNPLFCVNGVDKRIYPRLHDLLLNNGYKEHHISYSMRVDLTEFKVSDEMQELFHSLSKEGITFQAYSPDDMLEIRKYFMQEFPRWITHFIYKINRRMPADEMMIVKQGEQVVGYCQYNYYGQPERVGPFGTAASMRGKRIGQAMVSKLLSTMTCRGYQSAYFISCAEQVKQFYSRNGFRVFREKSVFQKQL